MSTCAFEHHIPARHRRLRYLARHIPARHRSPAAPPARHRSLQPSPRQGRDSSCPGKKIQLSRAGTTVGKKIPVVPWGDCSTLFYLTGEVLRFDRRHRSNQVSNRVSPKIPGRGPGAGLARASLSRSPTDCDTYLRELAPKRGWCV